MKTVIRDFPVLLLAGYFLLAALIYFAGGVEIIPPCLWRTAFGTECPGCGLNSAGRSIILLDFPGAWHANPLIYIVSPVMLYLVLKEIKVISR